MTPSSWTNPEPSPPLIRPGAETSRFSNGLSYAIFLGGCLTIALSLYLVATTYSSLPWDDGWTQIVVAANGRNPVSPAWLWEQHNEHRLVIPKIFLAVDLRFFGARQAFLLVSIFAIQLMHLALLSWSMRALGNWRGALWRSGTGLAAFCLFCPTQWENFVWGFQVCFVLPLFLATLSFVALLLYHRAESQPQPGKRTSSKFLVLSILAALGAAYSLANGNFVWPLLVLAGFYLRFRCRAILAIASVGTLSTLAYLHHYVRPEGHANPFVSLHAPLQILSYCSIYFFSSWPDYETALDLVLRIAVLISFLAALPYARKLRPFSIQLVLTMSYCVATALITASGRLNFGVSQAAASRYQTVALLFWCSLGLLWLGGALLAHSWFRHLFWVVQVCVLAIFIQGAARAQYPVVLARMHAFKQKTATVAVLTGIADPIEIHFEKDRLSTLHYMKTNRLSVFSDSIALTLGKRLDSVFPLADPSGCFGTVEAVVFVHPSYGSGLGPGSRILGWDWDRRHQNAPPQVIVTANDNVVGLGAANKGRPGRSDFVAFAPELPPGTTVNLYAILGDSPKSACYIDRVKVQ